ALVLLRVRRGQLVARGARGVRLPAQHGDGVQVRLEQRVEQPAPADQIENAGRPEQEADVPLPPQPVPRHQPRLHGMRCHLELRPRLLRALLGDGEPGRGPAQADLGRLQTARPDFDLPLQIRQPPEHAGLAASQRSGLRALVLEPLLHLGQRLRERGGGEQRDHALRNRETAIQLPKKPTRAPPARSAAACSGKRCGAVTPAANANAWPARGRSQRWALNTAPTAIVAPRSPWSAPSIRKGARTYPSVAPTSFMISISSR